MQRRDFVTLLGGTVLAWPLAARAQQSARPVIGFLSGRSAKDSARVVDAFGRGLRLAGYTEDKNLSLEYRWAEGKLDRLPELAADLVGRTVTVLVAAGGSDAALAAKNATSTIPIVFVIGSDPVKLGLAASFSHPGGITGVTMVSSDLGPKRLGLLHELVPKASTVAILTNPNSVGTEAQSLDLFRAAEALGVKLSVLKADDEKSINEAFAAVAREKIDALLVASDQNFDVYRDQLVALAATAAGIPTIYHFRDYAVAGGLMSYGPDVADAHQHVGDYAGQILNGKRPADLPVLQSTKFELVINLKTAKALGLVIPPFLLARADEVIE